MAKKKFPESLYVVIENEGSGDQFFAADNVYAPFAVVDELREVAVYKLIRVTKVAARAQIEE